MKLLSVFEFPSSFVKRDEEILSTHFDIVKIRIWNRTKVLLPFTWILAFFKLILLSISSDIILVQGGGYHSLISAFAGKITRTPVLIVVIGTDAIKMPEIRYGHFRNKPLAWCTRLSYQMASALLPVHKNLIEYDYSFEEVTHQKQGVKAFVKNLKTPTIEVNNGFDFDFWKYDPTQIREPNSFLTVAANVETSKRFLVKGIDLFLKMAEQLPESKFTLVGTLLAGFNLPINVRLLSNQSPEQLVQLYSEHKYYVQLSRSEGFPNSLCEAMLCGCIPIVSAVGGQPDIVGDCGIVIDKNDQENMRKGFESAISSPFAPENIRSRIITNFPISKRKDELLKVITSFTS